VSSIFIELSNSLAGENLTPLPLSMKPLKHIFQFRVSLLSKTSTHVQSIQSIVSCLCVMVLAGQTSNKLHTLDYDNILLQKSNFCRLLLMGTFYLNYCPSTQMFTTLPKCKTWTESMMAMLGTN
jgi:hypothetical protein